MDMVSDQDSKDVSEASKSSRRDRSTADSQRIQMQHMLDVRSLELAYEKTLRQTDILCETESARQLRVRILLLEDENDDLHEQLAQSDDRIDELEQSVQDVQDQLEIAGESLQRVQSDLRVKTREVETLKVSLQCKCVLTAVADNEAGRTKFHEWHVPGRN